MDGYRDLGTFPKSRSFFLTETHFYSKKGPSIQSRIEDKGVSRLTPLFRSYKEVERTEASRNLDAFFINLRKEEKVCHSPNPIEVRLRLPETV